MCYDINMNKNDIFDSLNNLKLDKNKYIVIGDASLVVQGVIAETKDISLACSKDYFDESKWDITNDECMNLIKRYDSFLLSSNYYDEKNVIIINDYKFMTIEKILYIKKILNRKKDKKIIEKIDLYLCLKDNKRYERDLYKKGINIIGGVDEVGRGPLIGPVVAACSVLPHDFELKGLTDSKKISEKKRNEFYNYLIENTIYGIGIVGPDIIDEINIYEATKLAMIKAINEVRKKVKLEHVLIDAMPLDLDIPTTSIIKGDLKSISISAASVIAKVTRDNMMIELDKKYPNYGYSKHKGYPTKKHIEAINKYGLIDGYRKSYGPVKQLIDEGNDINGS